MIMQQPVVHVRILAAEFGEPVDLGDLDDQGVRDNLAMLREQGYRQIRVATGSTAGLALAVTPGAPLGPANIPEFDAVIVCTDAVEGQSPGDWSSAYQHAAGLASVRVILVTGTFCANFAAGLDVARGMIASGLALNVLLVMVDRVVEGSRYTAISRSVYSDAAVSCLVSARPGPDSFRLLRTATETRLTRDGEWSEFADARTTILAMSRAAKRAAEDRPADRFDHVLTLNLGATARKLLSMAARVPPEHEFTGPVGEFGHCFAADIPLNLRALLESGTLGQNASILALASSRASLAAIALAFGPGEDALGRTINERGLPRTDARPGTADDSSRVTVKAHGDLLGHAPYAVLRVAQWAEHRVNAARQSHHQVPIGCNRNIEADRLVECGIF
jgi:3-oxoacyl-[acyl-carrier-protein] synthase III